MKYIQRFRSIQEGKDADIFSPALVNVEENFEDLTLNAAYADDDSLVLIGEEIDNCRLKKVDYLTFTCVEDGGISLTNYRTNASSTIPNIEYNLNNSGWTLWEGTATFSNIPLKSGDIIKMKGVNPNGISYKIEENWSKFVMSGRFEASGNIMSLIDGKKYGTLIIPGNGYCFSGLFLECESLISAPELPATTLTDNCYYGMFYKCTSLVNAPELPATALASDCYYCMFYNCTSLVNGPSELPALIIPDGYTKLQYGYSPYCCMFYSCTSLVNAPILPATTVGILAYAGMFYGCTSLVNAPVLPATILTSHCYDQMFRDCSNLSYVKCLATTGIGSNLSTVNWLYGAKNDSSCIFVKKEGTTWPIMFSGIPSNWTIINE